MEENKPSYYSILPATVRYDNDLNASTKILYAEITSLCSKHGFAYPKNNYFANLYNVSEKSISRWINVLKSKGYIYIKHQYKKGTKCVEKRIISLSEETINEISDYYCENHENGGDKNVHTWGQKCPWGMDKNVQDNNTSINKRKYIKEKFKKPTLEEVKTYCKERNNNVSPTDFIDYYESIGWVRGKTPIKDWKACVRTWEKNAKPKIEEPKRKYITPQDFENE